MPLIFPIRSSRLVGVARPRRRRLSGLGAPLLPDNYPGISFSPGTPDAIILQMLDRYGFTPTADQAALFAQARAVQSSAVAPSGQALSTQTGAAVTLANTLSIAPGVWQCTMSDGSQHYCDAAAQPISYTPPAPTPAVTPAASQPTATVAPAVVPASVPPVQFLGPPIQADSPPAAVTPSGTPISTTSGTLTPPAATGAPATAGAFDSVTTWLKGSMFGGIPNWMLAGGAALLMFGMNGGGGTGKKSSSLF